MGSRIAAAITVAALALLASGIATASADEEARVHFQQGVELYNAGQYEQAAIEFARAYELKPSYKILFNIGQAENEIRHYARALEAYTRYLAEGGSEVSRERVRQVKIEIRRLNTLVGLVTVAGAEVGVNVLVDGEVKGLAPLEGPVFVDVGRHEVELRRGGERIDRRVVRVAGGQRLQVNFAGEEEVEEPVDEGPVALDEPREPVALDPVYFYVGLGVTGALGVGAGVTWGLLGAAADERQAAIDNHDQASFDDANGRGKKLKPVTIGLLAATGAAVVTTVVLLVLTDFDDEGGNETVSVAPALHSDGGGLAVRGRF